MPGQVPSLKETDSGSRETWAEIQVFHSLYMQQHVKHLALLNFRILIHKRKTVLYGTLSRLYVINIIHHVVQFQELNPWHSVNGSSCSEGHSTALLTRKLERGDIREYKNTEQLNIGCKVALGYLLILIGLF